MTSEARPVERAGAPDAARSARRTEWAIAACFVVAAGAGIALAVCLVVLVIAVAGRVLLAAAVIAGIQWAVIHFWPGNITLVWVVLGVPALLAGYTLADALTGSTGLGSAGGYRRRGGSRR